MSGSTHTKKGRRRYLCDHFDSKDTHTTTTRETDCSSHITCVFRGVWDDEEVARPKRKAEAWVCDTADDLFKDAALVCMTLSLSSADDERRACFLCRRRRERFFSFHLVLLLIIKVVPFFFPLERERIFVCEKEREFFLLFFDYYGLRKREREREREKETR